MSDQDIHSSDRFAEDLPPDAPAEMPPPRLPRPPFWLIAIGLVTVCGTWIPLSLAARGRNSKAAQPRIALLQDMGVQPKLREQQTDFMFADQRAMRPRVAGTVARGDVEEDDHYYRGFYLVKDEITDLPKAVFYRGFPEQVKLTPELLARGQQRFNIYCSACHGMDGSGKGPVNQRALELQDQELFGTSWTQAADLRAGNIVGEEEGNIFNTITNGVRNMPPYGNQVPVEDRWAIVAYLRALEFSQNAPKSVLSAAELDDLNSQPSTEAATTAPATTAPATTEAATTEPAATAPATQPSGIEPAKPQ
jgi:mono/diheme cytochrome c family protein